MKAHGLVDNVTLLPFGLPQPPTEKQRHGGSPKLIASFGYLLAHKGLPQLIEAVSILRRDGLDVNLLMLNAIYPVEESPRMQAACENAIREHGLSEHVNLRTDYLSEKEVMSELAAADLVVYPYQQTQESASAAVRLGLASLAPVAVTPLPIFEDVAGITHRLPGTAAVDIAAGIKRLFTDSSELFRLAKQQETWVAAHQWQAVSRRLYDLVRGEFLEDTLSSSMRFRTAINPNCDNLVTPAGQKIRSSGNIITAPSFCRQYCFYCTRAIGGRPPPSIVRNQRPGCHWITEESAMSSFVTVEQQIEALYVGYFGRPGDPVGQQYWNDQIITGNTTYTQAAASFSVQVEAKALYSWLSTNSTSPAAVDQFITQIYQDLFNRNPDAAGLTFWHNSLLASVGNPQAVGQFILNIISGAPAGSNDDLTVHNKVDVAAFITDEVTLHGLT